MKPLDDCIKSTSETIHEGIGNILCMKKEDVPI